MRVELYGHQKGMLIKRVSFYLHIKKKCEIFLLNQYILKGNQNKQNKKGITFRKRINYRGSP